MDLWFGAYEEISGNHASLAGSTSSEISFHGPVGDAFVFDGLRHLNISPPQDGSPLPLFGVEFWFSTNDANVPFIRSASGYFDLELEEGQVKLTLIDPSGTYSIAGGAMLADGKNHHVVANINTQLDQIELYVDGAFVDHKSALQLAPSTFILQSEGLTVGTDGTKVFTGFIDEISLYDTPVAMGEVDSLFHAGAVGKCPL